MLHACSTIRNTAKGKHFSLLLLEDATSFGFTQNAGLSCFVITQLYERLFVDMYDLFVGHQSFGDRKGYCMILFIGKIVRLYHSVCSEMDRGKD